jgi:23S rRNA (uridine2552-2'-O)-methyltransferase
VARRTLHDRYFKQAKAEGYLARSAYKLIEINERFKLVRRGARVLDVGCAPGSWLQVAAELTGPEGRIVGIDLSRVEHPMPAHVATLVGDIERAPAERLAELAGGHFDLVLSDMAPNTSGHGDDLVSARLCRSLLAILPGLLAPGGALAMKIFEGQEYPLVLRETGRLFSEARGFKPKASREVSREMYIVAKGYRGAPEGGRDTGAPGGAG